MSENRYKAALDEMDRAIENGDFGGFDGMILVDGWMHENSIAAIRSALQLAQETEQLRLKLSETAIHLAARNSEIEQLRKERDELARAIIKIHEDQEGDYDFLKFISHPQYILAKKVAGE